MNVTTAAYLGEAIAAYGFAHGHPFSTRRFAAFLDAFHARGLDRHVRVFPPVAATINQLLSFHTPDYVRHVQSMSKIGGGFLDFGDTPAFSGVFEAAAAVVGCAVDAVDRIMGGEIQRAFIPIGGLHHAARDRAAGFCVFNDCGVAIQTLMDHYQLTRVAYVDIDAHHGDGVFYAFEDEPRVWFADIHEDGRFLYPGSGSPEQIGRGAAAGMKLNIALPPQANDAAFWRVWPQVEAFLETARPEFILLQCGADSVAGDPLTHLMYSPKVHGEAARRLCAIADRHSNGRVLAFGGGGYNLENIARAWCGVVAALCNLNDGVHHESV